MNGIFRLQTDDRPDCASPGKSEQAPSDLSIGILNHLFFWPELYRRTGGMSIVFLFDENPDVASAGSGGAAVGGARSVPDHAARSNSERAAPSARVGNRFSAPQIVWNKSNRCAGERGGARVGRPRWARILTITGGSSMAASDAAMISSCRRSLGSVRCRCRRAVRACAWRAKPSHARRVAITPPVGTTARAARGWP